MKATLLLLLLCPALALAKSHLDGSIQVINKRFIPVQLRIDGGTPIQIAANSMRLLKQVPNGRRVLEVKVPGQVKLYELPVPISRRAEFQIEAQQGLLKIKNKATMPLYLFLDGKKLGRLDPGKKKRKRLKPGSYILKAQTAKGKMSKANLKHLIEIKTGERSKVSLGPWHGQIDIKNPFLKRVRLILDGKRQKKLDVGATINLAKLSPGEHRLELRRKGEVWAKAKIRLKPGERKRWKPEERWAQLRVINQSQRSVKVKLGRGRSFNLAPGADRTRHLSPGEREIRVFHPDGDEEIHHLELKPREKKELEIKEHPPHKWLWNHKKRRGYKEHERGWKHREHKEYEGHRKHREHKEHR